jgi:hypothetical protein
MRKPKSIYEYIVCHRNWNFFTTFVKFHPSIHPSVRPSVHLSVCLPVYLCVYLSVYLCIYLPTYLPICLSISIYMSVRLSVYRFVIHTYRQIVYVFNVKNKHFIFVTVIHFQSTKWQPNSPRFKSVRLPRWERNSSGNLKSEEESCQSLELMQQWNENLWPLIRITR